MKVIISAAGKWHMYDLARELHKRDALAQLIIPRPKAELAAYDVPLSLVTNRLFTFYLTHAWARLAGPLRSWWNPQFRVFEAHDRFAARNLRPGADVLYAWSAGALHSLRRARQMGMVPVMEKANSHMAEQTEILEEEYARLGLKFRETHPRVYEKELAEYEEAEYIFVGSGFVRDSFIKRGVSESKLILVNYGFNEEWFHPVPKEDDTFRIIHGGALSLRKGVHYLLQAFRELNLPNSELWLVGGFSPEFGPFLERYRSPKVVVHGFKPSREMGWYYCQANVFCLASVDEGLARAQLEAMACGVPVLATTNTGIADVVRDGREGFIVPIRDVEALKEKIIWCYEHPDECRVMGEAARKAVTPGLSWDNYGDKMLAALQRIAHRS